LVEGDGNGIVATTMRIVCPKKPRSVVKITQ